MPLVSCPDCYAEVSDMAPTCPRCGRPMRWQQPPWQPHPPQYGPTPPNAVVRTQEVTSPVTWGCAMLIALAVLGVLLRALTR